MTLLAKNLLLIAVGAFLVNCVWQWDLYRMEEVRERLIKQTIPVIVNFDPSFVLEGLIAASIGCLAYRLNLRQTKTLSSHPMALSTVIACVVAALSLVLSVVAMAIGTLLAI